MFKFQPPRRYALPDVLRGLTIISMIGYHTVWDMVFLFDQKLSWFTSDAGWYWQQSICCAFILLSGFCQPLGRQSWQRGLEVFAAGLLVSAVTALTEPVILCGVLTLLGSCMLLLRAFGNLLFRVGAARGLLASLLLFMLTRYIYRGFIGIGQYHLWELPDALYANLFSAWLGFPYQGFRSADYFPLLPWLFLYMAGFFACRLLKEHDRLHYLRFGQAARLLRWLGGRSLSVYLLHQPLVYALLYIFFRTAAFCGLF